MLLVRGEGDPIALPAARRRIDVVALLPAGRIATADEDRRLRVMAGDRVAAGLELPTRIKLVADLA